MRQGQHLQRPLDLAVHDRVQEPHPLQVGELDGAQALGAPEVELLDLDGAVLAGGLALLLDADDGAGEVAGLGDVAGLQGDLDLLAAGLVEDLAEGGVGGEVDGEGLFRVRSMGSWLS